MLVAKAFLLQFRHSAQSFLHSWMSTSHTNSILFETDRHALLVPHSREKSPVWQTCLKHTEFACRCTQTQQLCSPQTLVEVLRCTAPEARSFTGKREAGPVQCPALISVNSPSCQTMVWSFPPLFCWIWATVKKKKNTKKQRARGSKTHVALLQGDLERMQGVLHFQEYLQVFP